MAQGTEQVGGIADWPWQAALGCHLHAPGDQEAGHRRPEHREVLSSENCGGTGPPN